VDDKYITITPDELDEDAEEVEFADITDIKQFK